MNTLLPPLRLYSGSGLQHFAVRHGLLPSIVKTTPPIQWHGQHRRGLLTTTLADPGFLSVVPANIMTAVHAAGIPWIIALPASALLIRTSLIYPIIHRRRRNVTKLALLQPLVDARISHKVLADQWSQSSKFKSQQSIGDQQRARRGIRSARTIEEIRLERSFKIPTARIISKVLPVLILLAVSEGVRRLCGMERGLLSILFGPFQPYIEGIASTIAGVLPKLTSSAVEDSKTPKSEGTDTSGSTSMYEKVVTKYNDFQSETWIQSSLRDGGLPWCADLTKSDPTHVLPVIFSSIFFATIWFSPKEVKRGSFYSQTNTDDVTTDVQHQPEFSDKVRPRRTFWQKFMLGVSILSIVPAWNMPTALVWYFIFNIGISRLQTRHVNIKFPITVPPLACRTRASTMSSTDRLGLRPVLGQARRHITNGPKN